MAQIITQTLELRTPRTCEQTAQAMAGFFATLPSPPTGLMNFYKSAPHITLEFFNQGQTIYTLLTLPQALLEYISSQLASMYPEILLIQLKHNPLDEFLNPGTIAINELSLHSHSYLPLKTYKDIELDPLTSVLSAFSKFQEGETGLIQLTLRKSREVWKTSAPRSMPEKTPHPHAALIETKLSHPSIEFKLMIMVRTQTKERSESLLHSISQSYSGFSTQANSLVVARGAMRKAKLQEDVLNRTWSPRKKHLSLDEAATLFHLPNKTMSHIKNIAWGKSLLGEAPSNLPVFASIPEEQRNDINLFAHVDFKNQDQVFGIKREDRRRHMYAIGKSGTGKSTLLANMIIHDLKHGEGLAVIDPHGDLIETVLNYIPKSRINDVIIFDPSDPHAVVKLNLFEGGSIVHRELIASGIVSIFQKMYVNSWGPRLEYILRNTLLSLLSQNAKLEDVLSMLTDAKFRARAVERMDDQVLKNFWLAEFNTMPDRQRSEAVAPILNKVGQFVTSPLIRNVINTQTSSFDIEEVMNQGKILLVNVSQGKLGEDNAALLGALMITKIQLAAMSRVYVEEEKRRDFYLYIDEFQNFATTSFVKILSEARKYRLNLILANQYMDQVPDDVKAAIFGNAGTMLSFILGASDAEYMKKEYGDKYTTEDLVSLGRYQIIVKLMIENQTSSPFPAYTLDLAKSFNQNKEKVLRVSKERYARNTS